MKKKDRYKVNIQQITSIIAFFLAIFEVYEKNWLFALTALLSSIFLTKKFEDFITKKFKTKLSNKVKTVIVILLITTGFLSIFQQQVQEEIEPIVVVSTEKNFQQDDLIIIEDNEIKITNIEITDRIGQIVSGQLLGDEADGKFVLISIEINGKLPIHNIIDIQQNIYIQDREAKFYHPEAYSPENDKGILIYDLPKEVESATMRFSTSKETAYVELIIP